MTRRKYYALAHLVALAFICALIGSCSKLEDSPHKEDEVLRNRVLQDRVLRIVASTTQAGDLARIITKGADNIELATLMSAGVDPHLYQPTLGDITLMNNANLIIYSGLHLEGQFDRVFEALQEQDTHIHALSQIVWDSGFVIGLLGKGSSDPHFWFDPRNWILSTQDFARVMAELDPAQAGIFMDNAEAYTGQLLLLIDWARQGLQSVAEQQRYLVTSHDAFQYFGDAFGWTLSSIQGLSTQDAAGVGDIQETVNFVLENNIPVLFVESSIPPDTIDAVIEAIQAGGGSTQRGIRELFADAMGSPGTFGGTYIGMIAYNVYTILQSYQHSGAQLTIPPWPQGLVPQPPPEMLGAQQ